MIDGVVIQNLTTYPDERGFFREVSRPADIGAVAAQISHARRLAGVMNGWHIHEAHSEVFYVANGLMRLALKDCRGLGRTKIDRPYNDLYGIHVDFGSPSSTYNEYMEVVMGEYNPVVVSVPPGVAHAYRVFSDVDIFYFATATYETSRNDEGRIEAVRWPGNDWTRGYEPK
jgi:dTDP-4-dehydrorhamnose 3,5-epimerase